MGMRFNDSTAYARSMGPAPEDGQSAWEEVRDAVLARTGTAARRPNLEVQEAAERMMSAMGALHADPVLYGRMKVLASHGMFRLELLGRTQTLAWALWYCRSQAKASTALPSWKVPQALVDEGAEVRARMLRVMKYHLEFDAEDGPKVTSVTLVNDRRELANHLRLLGDVATAHADLLAGDRQWRPTDVKRAFELSKEFSLALGASESVDWDERSAVLYAMLQESYADVLVTGRWLLREQPGEGERRFPKLVPFRGNTRRAASAEEGADGGDAEDEDATGDATPANDGAVAQPAAPAPAVTVAPAKPAPAAVKAAAKKSPAKKAPAKKGGR